VGEQQQVVAVAALPGTATPPETLVRHGEHPREAAAEQGVHVSATGLQEVSSHDDAGRHVLRIVYQAQLLPGPPPAPGPPPGPNGAPQVQRAGAYAVLVHDGRILLTRLAYTRTWTLPGGGIDHGESPLDAVCREVHEETGLVLTEPRLLDVDSLHFTGHAPDGTLEDFHAVRVLYGGTVDLTAEPRVVEVGGSSDAAAWRRLDELDDRDRRRFAVALRHVR
jgi:8-oxo-dGTP pyrophosphatase MutT (NUDIX family)